MSLSLASVGMALRPQGARASCCDAARRRRHEFRADRIGYRFAQDPIDLGLGGRIERPAADLVDRLQLTGMARAPQRRGDPLVQHPTDRQVDAPLAEALLREAIEPIHGGKILREAWLLEFWVRAAQVVAVEFGIRPHPAGE